MLLNLETNSIDSSLDFNALVFSVTDGVVNSLFARLIYHMMNGSFAEFMNTYDGDDREAFWEYVPLHKMGEL